MYTWQKALPIIADEVMIDEKNLIVTVPPGHGKTGISTLTALYLAIANPEKRVIYLVISDFFAHNLLTIFDKI